MFAVPLEPPDVPSQEFAPVAVFAGAAPWALSCAGAEVKASYVMFVLSVLKQFRQVAGVGALHKVQQGHAHIAAALGKGQARGLVCARRAAMAIGEVQGAEALALVDKSAHEQPSLPLGHEAVDGVAQLAIGLLQPLAGFPFLPVRLFVRGEDVHQGVSCGVPRRASSILCAAGGGLAAA